MEADAEKLSRSASVPHEVTASSSMRKALVLTTPRRQSRKSIQRTTLQPIVQANSDGAGRQSKDVRAVGFSATASGGFARGSAAEPSPPSMEKQAAAPAPTTAPPSYGRNSAMKPSSSESAMSGKHKRPAGGTPSTFSPVGGGSGHGSGGDSDENEKNARLLLTRLQKKLHKQACQLQEVRGELERSQQELARARAEADELRLKHSNLERLDRRKSSELLEERRKNDELSKQVKEMSANLLSLCGSMEGGGANSEGSGLRKRCFKLVQQNTALSVQSRLLRRQKGWAEAKARVLQNEVTRVYLGIHDRVKGDKELESITVDEFSNRHFPSDEAQVYQLLLPTSSAHQEAIVDFLTQITHTSGNDIHGFLHSETVFSEQIRNDCLSGLAREFYAVWRRYNQLPHILRAVERIVHLSDYLAAFESFSSEITSMLGCGHAKIWVVDRFRQCMWTCVAPAREGEPAQTFTLPLPRGKNADLSGKGIVSAAYLTQKPVNVTDAREDPRFRQEEAGPDGHAKSVVCVPVYRNSKGGRKPEVRVVLQAVNKLLEPHFDPEGDVLVLRLLGKVSMEVLQVCETSSAASMNTRRKEALLQLLIECTPCEGPATLLQSLDRGLRETFLSEVSALHVIVEQGIQGGRPHGSGTAKLTLDHNARRIVYVPSDGLKGIIGEVARKGNQISIPFPQVESSRHDASVDIVFSEKTVLHTVPIFDSAGATCVAVTQFCCPEKERTMLSDDGAYNPDNREHFQLLKKILTFVQKHLEVVQKQDELLKQADAMEKDKEVKRIQEAAEALEKDKERQMEMDRDKAKDRSIAKTSDAEDVQDESVELDAASRQASVEASADDDKAKKGKKVESKVDKDFLGNLNFGAFRGSK